MLHLIDGDPRSFYHVRGAEGPEFRISAIVYQRREDTMRGTLSAVILSSALIIAGCERSDVDDTTGPGTGSGYGTMTVRMTDAPGGYEAVTIAVDSVRVHVESGDTLNGWYTISRAPATYNLLDYTNGRDTLIAEGAVPAGIYSQMRLYIGQGCSVTENGVMHPLEIPSGSQSGLKLNIHATIFPGVKYVLMLDFDAGRSIVTTGNGRYKLKPVISTVAMAVTGSLTGRVAPDTTYAAVWAVTGADTSTTNADPTGLFKFGYLPPATYRLTIVPADTTYRDTTLTNILVSAAQNTDVGTITLQKK